MTFEEKLMDEAPFEKWLPLAEKVVTESLRLHWKDVLEVYTYVPTIPLAEALALSARRAGSDTHITLMTDDLWFTSMQELPLRWLRAPSEAEFAINQAATAYIYLGGPQDARRMRSIAPEKFEANAIGGMKQDKPKSRRGVRSVDLPVGRVSPDRAEAYGLNFDLWQKSYNAALASDLSEIRRAGEKWMSRLRGRKRVRVVSDFGTDLRFVTAAARPMVDDGIISSDDVRRGFVETSLPAGKFVSGILPGSAKGKICFTDPVFLMGRSVIGLQLELERGRLTHWSAKENADILTSTLGNRRSVGNYLGWFSIGLNSAVEPCMLDNSIVQNDVGIGFGPHPLVEPSKIRPRVSFEGTIGLVEIETG